MGSSMWFILWCSCVLCCNWSQTAFAETTKQHTSLDGFSVGDTYDCGPYNATVQLKLKSPCCHKPGSWSRKCPCGYNLVVAAPIEDGAYPVVQFQHGTDLDGSAYKDVIHQIATWGFIVVAPKMYDLVPPVNAFHEINDARAILNWLSTGLVPVLSPWTNSTPCLEKIALVGHSRGGKVVYGVALNVTSSTIAIPHFSAVVGLDPVDGHGNRPFPEGQIKPAVLTHINNSLHLGDDVQTLVVGTGLGSTGHPPCAPENYGHKYFYDDVAPPAYRFVASTEGHMDFCDCDNILELCGLCKNGKRKDRPNMHRFTGGIVAAFLQKALLHNSTAFDAAYALQTKPPVELLSPESKLPQIPHLAQSHQHASV